MIGEHNQGATVGGNMFTRDQILHAVAVLKAQADVLSASGDLQEVHESLADIDAALTPLRR